MYAKYTNASPKLGSLAPNLGEMEGNYGIWTCNVGNQLFIGCQKPFLPSYQTFWMILCSLLPYAI